MPLPESQRRRLQDRLAAILAEAESLEAAVPLIMEALGLPAASDARGLEAERDRLAEILEATTDFVGIADIAGNILYANRALRDLLGPASVEPGRPVRGTHPAWAARKVLEEGIPAAHRERTWRGETAFLDQDGREIPTSQVILAHRDSSGELLYFSTIARDISEQKHSEQALKDLVKHLEDLRYAVDQFALFAVTDRRGVITEVNERFCQVSGYRRDELLGETHRIINSGHHPKAFFKEMWDTILAGRVWRGEICNRAKGGSIYWVDSTIVPWLDANGRPERFISLRTVISERKQAEAALLLRERQMELLANASRELNQESDLSLVMRRLVETATKLLSVSSGAYGLMDGETLRIREFLRDAAWEEVDLAYQKGQGAPGWVMETLQPCISDDAVQDPRVTPEVQRLMGFRAMAAVPILDRKGSILGFFGVHDHRPRAFSEGDRALLEGLAAHAAVAMENARQIETRRREEEALRHTQKLESLGLLAGGIAHDFNNLLSAILGNLNLAMLEVIPDSPLDRRLQNIDRAIMRAADLTRQMLAYTGKGQFQKRRLDLNATVGEIARLLEASLPKKISLEFHLQEGIPPLDADPAQIEQVLLNLVTNAADAIGDQEGNIRLATGFRELAGAYLQGMFPGQSLAPGAYLTLDVTDNGSGIPPEVLDRIFDPFFTTKSKGRGLGLSAMLGILRAHHGGIKIYTEPGRGSTFRIFLPAAEAGAAAEEDQPGAKLWHGQGRILVVDDDEEVRASTRSQLEALGFETLEARDGQEAVQIFEAQRGLLALVFMDLSMPHMDGNEALQAIRNLDPEARVILCSGFDRGATGPARSANGPNAFLQKPFRIVDLCQVLRDVLEGPRP
jgi:PAS domain S-box-containing protein